MEHDPKKDMEPSQILYLLRAQRLSYADVDRMHNLTQGAALHASRKPHEAGENALAAVLDKPAKDIWPTRYDRQTGERLKPQPKANNTPKRTLRHRKKKSNSSSCGQSANGAAA